MRAPVIIALTATLVGCSSQPPHQTAAGSCTDKDEFASSRPTAAAQPVELTSFKIDPPAKESKFTIAAQTEKPPSHRAHLATRKAKPATVAAKGAPPATRTPVLPPSSSTQLEPKGNAAVGSGTTGQNIADSRSTVPSAPNSNGKTIREQVLAATAVAERLTRASVATAQDGAAPIAGASPNNTDHLVAVIMARPEIGSVADLVGKTIAVEDKHSASSIDIKIAIVAAGGPVVQLSAGRLTAIDRLLNGEVPAAVLALASADAAEAFPEVAGFRILRIRLLKHQP